MVEGQELLVANSTHSVQSDSDSESDIEVDVEDANSTPHPPQQPHAHSLRYDPGERIPISRYDVNVQDDVRREYILKGPCQPYEHTFETTKKNKRSCRGL